MSTLLAPALMPALAWTPILDPLPLSGGQWWLTIVPLALGVAITYKAVRFPDIAESWPGYGRAVVVMTVQILLLILGLAAGLHIIVTWAAPALGG